MRFTPPSCWKESTACILYYKPNAKHKIVKFHIILPENGTFSHANTSGNRYLARLPRHANCKYRHPLPDALTYPGKHHKIHKDTLSTPPNKLYHNNKQHKQWSVKLSSTVRAHPNSCLIPAYGA